MKLSDQALGALMMALQKGLLEKTDITALIREFEFLVTKDGELEVHNPPTFQLGGTEEPEDN